jgi:hypothetical protein
MTWDEFERDTGIRIVRITPRGDGNMEVEVDPSALQEKIEAFVEAVDDAYALLPPEVRRVVFTLTFGGGS